MAKFTPGPMVAAVSGSQGGTVFSRNRYGAYTRFRAVPITSTTDAAVAAKAALAAASQAWQGLTADQKQAWAAWARSNPITDKLGQAQTLTGHAAYSGNHARALSLAVTPITDPPIIAAPAPISTITQSCDIGAGTFDLTFTPTPTGAAEKLWLRVAIVDSAGITYVQNLLKFVGVSGAAQASPFDHQTLVEARFGTLIVGQSVHTEVRVVSTASMLLSAPIKVVTVIVTT